MSKTIVAIFDQYRSAETAARQVKDEGLKTDDISIVAKDEKGNVNDNNQAAPIMGTDRSAAYMGTGTGNNGAGDSKDEGIRDNISGGVVSGGLLGGLAGLLIGAGSMMIPGLGIIAAAGPITGLISGAVTGGIVGGLVDLGIPENRSRQYESDVKAGKILFSMKTDEEKISRIGEILRQNGAVSVDSY